ncbi:glycoside hydrolase family protein [Streptomyces triticirhizae]|uniref:Non-reducing end beta-L-arabinofuranosidase-like GH127 middle domain-containing protein n=1 Tax=Streptomyces triticirhizae TaxID=2483353 RepID=A0A3M2M513_9ACTN|nr:beta-L-arabinofuranosidase domain-containing protein [Streptomyces triticirhizae]RMI43555.1 hypothetical protein EBN88_07045 [Streptomyces triticirhizae]
MGIRHTPLALGEIRPAGWLRRQLRLQAEGLTGRVEEIWPDLGPESGWLGGPGEDWERGPYYLDGLVPLAHVLDDEALREKASKWIEWILASQRDDGGFGPESNDDWWPRMVALKVLVQHADATGDERVPGFLARYFAYQLEHLPGRPLAEWGAVRATENVLAALWLHRRDGDPRWLELSELLLEQNADWVGYLTGEDLITGPATVFAHLTHGPNVAMGLKVPAVRALLDAAGRSGTGTGEPDRSGAAAGEPDRYAELTASLAALDRWHGQVHGMFSGDEWLAGREAHHGIETCQVMEYLFTLEQSALAFGEGTLGDLAELVAFNHLPAAFDPEMRSHQYHQQANQIAANIAERRWTLSSDDANIFGLEPHFGCCLANMHQGWPKFVASLWMRSTEDNGLTAFAYAPSTLRTTVDGTEVTVEQTTDYPFDETVRLDLTVSAPVRFPLRLRVPGWCRDDATLTVDGETVTLSAGADGYAVLDRTWSGGERIELTLPMRLRKERRERGALGLRLGPLVLVAALPESWRPLPNARGLGEWEVLPLSSWNYGLYLGDGLENWPIERAPVPELPFGNRDVAVTVRGRGARVYSWRVEENSAAVPPDSPVLVGSPVGELRLVPYGCARIRLAELPTVLPANLDAP